MNFKGFLKRTGFTLLVEENEFNKEAFIRKSYKRVFKEKADMTLAPTEMWKRVLTKSAYKFKKGTTPETKQATIAAHSAVNQLKKLKQQHSDLDLEETGTDDRDIKGLVSELNDNEKQYFLDFLRNNENTKNFIGDDFKVDNLPHLEDTLNGDQNALNAVKEKLDEIFSEEIKDEDIPEWKEKTVSELDDEDFTEDDFKKIQSELNKIEGFETVQTLDDLKNAIKNKNLDPNQVNDLDKILNTETQTTPAEPKQEPANGTTDTTIVNNQAEVEERILQKQKEERLKQSGVPLTPEGLPDFTQEKTFEIMAKERREGRDDLWNEYIKSAGLEDTEYGKQELEKIRQEEERKKQAIEDQKQRFENEKNASVAISGFFTFLNALSLITTGKSGEAVEKWTEQQKLIKTTENAINNDYDNMFNGDGTKDNPGLFKQADLDHAAQLQAIENDYKAQKQQIEDKLTKAVSTNAFKDGLLRLNQEKNKKLQERQKQRQESVAKSERNESLRTFLINSSTMDDENFIRNIQEKGFVKPNEGETEEAFKNRLLQEKNNIIGELQKEHENLTAELANIPMNDEDIKAEFEQKEKELENSKEVQDELKENNKNKQILLSSLEAQKTLRKNKEQEYYQRKIRVYKEQQREAKQFAKKFATICTLSSKPEETAAAEMLNFNQNMKRRYDINGITFASDKLPTDLESVKKKIQEMKQAQNGMSGMGMSSLGKGKPRETEVEPKEPKGKPSEGEPGVPEPKKPGQAKKDLDNLKASFKDKKLAENRLNAFLKTKNIDPETVKDSDLQKALEDFKNQKFPTDITEDALKSLGITEVPEKPDGTGKFASLQEYAEYLKTNKDALNKLKEDLGFEDTGKAKPNSTPLTIKTEKFDDVKDYLNGFKLKDGTEITAYNWEQFKNNDEVKAKLQSPDVLKKLSEGQTDSEKSEINGIEGDVEEIKDGTKLKDLSLKTLWTKLNNAGISIRSLPGYDPNWTEEDKRKAIKDYLLQNKTIFGIPETITESKIRKTAFKRFNEVSKAQQQLSEKRSLKKFAELLVNDLRTFG